MNWLRSDTMLVTSLPRIDWWAWMARRLVADLSLDKHMLQDVLRRKL